MVFVLKVMRKNDVGLYVPVFEDKFTELKHVSAFSVKEKGDGLLEVFLD